MNITVNISELQKKSQRMRKILAEYKRGVNQIYKDCLANVEHAWKSDEHMEFTRNFDDYLKDLNQLGNNIEEYITLIDEACNKYEAAKNEAASVASKS